MGNMLNVKTVAFFGHSKIYRDIDEELDQLLRELISKNEYVEFLVGRNGDFDRFVSSAIRRLKKEGRDENFSHILVLQYMTAEFRDSKETFYQYYDEIEVNDSVHPKRAILDRNKKMIDRADFVVFYIEHFHGGAYQSIRYAQKSEKEIINLFPLPL